MYYHLNPNNLKIDDRSIDKILHLILKFSEEITFFSLDNKPNGSWKDLLIADESFLLSLIINYDLKSQDKKRLDIIRYFDQSVDSEEQKKYFDQFYRLIYNLFLDLNDWYEASVKNNTRKKSSPIEFELEQAIENKLKGQLHLLFSYYESIKSEEIFDKDYVFDLNRFSSIWNINQVSQVSIFKDIDPSLSKMNSALKRLILLYNPLYEVMFSIISKSKKLFLNSLELNDSHQAHTGLLIAFVNLYKVLQNDINKLSTKHLELYYKHILQQKKELKNPGKLFVTALIESNTQEVFIPKGSSLIAGQYSDGSDIIFNTDYDVILNSVQISELKTNFLSRNQIYDYNSSFNLVTGYFSKTHCSSIDEVQSFNDNNQTFSTFGEEQLFKSKKEITMEPGEIGFAISSPVFVLDVSNRTINFDLQFTSDSIKYISNIIIDISNRSGLSEEEIFSKIFSTAFKISFTTEQGWHSVKKYSVKYPDDWTTGVIGIEITLDKRYPAISSYQEDNHKRKFNTRHPVFEWILNDGDFYYPYSFLSGMELKKIDINVKVSKLKNLTIYNSTGYIDTESEFELFGPTPKIGTSIQFGAAELFCKKIDTLSFEWDYTNLPAEYKNLEEYFKSYKRGLTDKDFKFNLSALSDFTYSRPGSENIELSMFNLDDDQKINKSLKISGVNLNPLKIKPNYLFRNTDYEIAVKDIETGFFRLELKEPIEAFGFEIYSKIYTEIMQSAASEKLKDKKSEIQIDPPNEAFSPMVSDLSVSYQSKTSIFLSHDNALENDTEEANKLYHVSPYGTESLIEDLAIVNSNLLPFFSYEGELIIGLQKVDTAQNLNILFEISKKENTDYEFARTIEWFYSGYDGWRPLEREFIISDETINLIQTGVFSFSIPKDISNNSKLFKSDNFYIKACSRSKADQFGLIKSVRTNAFSASESNVDQNQEFISSLPINSIEEFKLPISGVLSLEQPIASSPGFDKETDLSFYKRVSQLLKHKNRLVTSWDYEQYILNKFNWLSKVKCLPHKSKSHEENRINVRLMCLKKIQKIQNVDEVKLTSAEILEIKNSIKKNISPFVKLEIVNPVFEDLWVKCKVKFKNLPSGRGIIQLNKDLFEFVCPWLYDSDENYEFSSKIKKSDIVNFIKKRPYIQYVTGISIIHIRILEDGSRIFYDSALDNSLSNYIHLGSSRSVVVPRSNHQIKIIEEEVYELPEPINYKDLAIDENFIVSSNVEEESQQNQKKILKDKKITLNFKL